MRSIRGIVKRVFNIVGLDVRRYRPRVPFLPEAVGEHNASQGTVDIASFAWASANDALDYINRQLYTRWDFDAENYNAPIGLQQSHKWGLKGFGYSLVVDTVRKFHSDGKRRLNILDVGGGGSGVCRFLCDEFSDACWLVDDFGIESGDTWTAGWYEPDWRESLLAKNPKVTYVFGRLGEVGLPELREGTFDLIFSVSTLEHIPLSVRGSVFDHMLALLAPNGWMVHTIDMTADMFPEWQTFLADYFEAYGVAPAVFATRNLDELDEDSAPLLESLEVRYTLNGHQHEYHRQGTVVLGVHRSGAAAGFGKH